MAVGSAPAITALMAIFSTVTLPWRGIILPTRWSGGRSVPVSISSTADRVGGMTGSPSVQPRR